MRLCGSRFLVHSCLGLVGLTAFAGNAAASVPAGSLIVNGSFEDPVKTGGFFASIPGWTPSVPCTAQGAPIQVSPFGGQVVDGAQARELNTGCAGNGIQQIVPTSPGTTYTLTYAYSPRPGSLDEDNEMEVWFDGDLVETVGPLTPDAGFDWRLRQVDVTASGTSAVLEFVAVGGLARCTVATRRLHVRGGEAADGGGRRRRGSTRCSPREFPRWLTAPPLDVVAS